MFPHLFGYFFAVSFADTSLSSRTIHVWVSCSCLRPLVYSMYNHSLSSVQLLSHVWFFATSWTSACQASLFITNSWSLHKLMSIALVMPSNHLILWCPLLLLPSIFPRNRVFSNESVFLIRRPKYWFQLHLQYSCLENPMDRGAWWTTV